MGLTSLAYIPGIIVLIMATYIRDRIGGKGTSRAVYYTCIGLALMGIFVTLSIDLTSIMNPRIARASLRLSVVMSLFASLNFFLTSLFYPYDPKTKIGLPVAWLLSLAGSWPILFTNGFISEVSKVQGSISMSFLPGPLYVPGTIAIWSLMALASLILLIRLGGLKSHIFRLQNLSIALLGLLCAALGAFSYLFVMTQASRFFLVITFVSLVFLLGVHRIISITKVFDLKEVAGRVFVTIFFSLIAAVPVGLAASWAINQVAASGTPAVIGLSFAVFFVAIAAFSPLADLFYRAFNLHGNYLQALEKGLSEIDYSQGRGVIYEKLSELLRTSMNFNDFNILIEDQEGNLVTSHSNCGVKYVLDRKNSPIEFLINMRTDILLKTEAIANYNFHTVKPQLLAIFDALKADIIIVLREGHHTIGMLSLGPKKTGTEYTTYDSLVLKLVYGKLFAIGFYLKNIAKESILTTVDRELQYSNQIIQSIQENYDHVTHPKVDIAFVSKSAHRLGGDYVDFVKINNDRWFFTVGDVSGKGLNASMSMIILKSTIRIFLGEERDFGKLVIKVNSFIKNSLPRGTFFAGVFGFIDFSRDTLYFVNCGVPVIFMYSPQFNNVMEVQGEGRVLGFAKDYAPFLKLRKIALHKGSTIMITTDGIIESETIRAERFGKERVQRCVSEYRNNSAEQIVNLTYKNLDTFVSGEINDDVTILAMKYL